MIRFIFAAASVIFLSLGLVKIAGKLDPLARKSFDVADRGAGAGNGKYGGA